MSGNGKELTMYCMHCDRKYTFNKDVPSYKIPGTSNGICPACTSEHDSEFPAISASNFINVGIDILQLKQIKL